VIASLGRGGASAISKYFDENVDITILDKSNNYGKSQAKMVLYDFLNSHPVLGFEIIQKNSEGDRPYCVGRLLTGKGNFKTTLRVRMRGGRPYLQEIRIEK
jgi:hypothetical protein